MAGIEIAVIFGVRGDMLGLLYAGLGKVINILPDLVIGRLLRRHRWLGYGHVGRRLLQVLIDFAPDVLLDAGELVRLVFFGHYTYSSRACIRASMASTTSG